jgi:hypothetical protein
MVKVTLTRPCEADRQVRMVWLTAELAEFAAAVARDLLRRAEAEHLMPVIMTNTKTKTELCQRVYPSIRR